MKKGGIIILTELIQERNFLMKELESMQMELRKLPEGKLIYSQTRGRVKWYESNGSKPRYIPKKEEQLAVSLALRKYYCTSIEELSKQIYIINRCINSYENPCLKSEKLINPDSPFSRLLRKPLHIGEKLDGWATESFVSNPMNTENLILPCLAGHCVRSKSEVIIANTLYQNKIPYRYECQLQIGSKKYYPDFTIMHPRTHFIFYWEHFGMLEIPSYRRKANHKVADYAENDIYPSKNLILTYESADHPIDSVEINNIVLKTFCR